MTTLQLPGLNVTLHPPVKIVEAVGHAWFPALHRFASGELVAHWSMMPDIFTFAYVAGNSHSTDGGRTWTVPYSTGQFCNLSMPLADGNLRLIPYYMYPAPPTQRREFVTDLYTMQPGGNHSVAPRSVPITGLPRDIAVESTGAARFNIAGSAITHDGRWLVTIYGQWADSPAYTFDLALLESTDEGRSYRYVSTIARHGDVTPRKMLPESRFEGADESSLCVLPGGDLLSIFRTGSGMPQWPYQFARSSDGGKTWTRPEIMSEGVGSVEPSLVRMTDDTLALSGGRPGVHLWLSTDATLKQWHNVNIAAHHNAVAAAGERIQVAESSASQGEFFSDKQTTAYTYLREIKPGRLLMLYDRCALGWAQVPHDSPAIDVRRG
jgi:hypothetical protein